MNLFRNLVFALLAGNVLLRFFTNQLNILPRIFNLWDVFVTIGLALLAIFLPRASGSRVDVGRIGRRLAAFNAIAVIGSLLNGQFVHPMAALSQLIMWNEPVVLFLALVNAPFTLADLNRYRGLLLFLIGLELAIGLLQVPVYLKTGASEAIIGTFPGNAEQYQLFILIGFFYLLARLQTRQGNRLRNTLGVVGILILVVLIDNKASWVMLALTVLYLVHKVLACDRNVTVRAKQYVIFGVLLLVGYSAVKFTSETAGKKYGKLYEAWQTGNILNLGKVKAFRDVLKAYRQNPEMALVGSGLGTFYSRAAFQYFPFSIRDIYQAEMVYTRTENDSASMSGVIKPIEGMEPFYRQFYKYVKIYPVGSGTADFPMSSYLSLFAETGLMGAILYLSIFVYMLRLLVRSAVACREDPEVFPFLTAAVGVMFYLMMIANYNFWLDSGRVNTIAVSLAAIGLAYQRARENLHGLAVSPREMRAGDCILPGNAPAASA